MAALAVVGAGPGIAIAAKARRNVAGDRSGQRHARAHRAGLSGQAPAGGFVDMTTQPNGVAVSAGPASTVIYVTTDGGQHWHPEHIS